MHARFETEFLATCSEAFVAAYRAGDSYARSVVQAAWDATERRDRERREYRAWFGHDPLWPNLD